MGEKSGSGWDAGEGFFGKLLIGIIAVVVIAFAVSAISSSASASPEFAQCLTDKGAVMYGTDWCKYCQKQKEMFGEAFSNINYINCDENRAACELAGVRGYPTWEINGRTYSGLQQLEELAELSGCGLGQG